MASFVSQILDTILIFKTIQENSKNETPWEYFVLSIRNMSLGSEMGIIILTAGPIPVNSITNKTMWTFATLKFITI